MVLSGGESTLLNNVRMGYRSRAVQFPDCPISTYLIPSRPTTSSGESIAMPLAQLPTQQKTDAVNVKSQIPQF